MANPHQGEVEFVGHTLCYTSRAWAVLESKFDCSMQGVLTKFQDEAEIRTEDVITLIWAGLRPRHPDITEDEAAALLDDVGIQAAIGAAGEAIKISPPLKGAVTEGEANGSRPRKAKGKIRSTS